MDKRSALSRLRTALAAAAAGAILAGCPSQQPLEEPDGGIPQNDGGIPQNDGGVPLPDEEFPTFMIDACVTDQELTETARAARPTLSGALRFDDIIEKCPPEQRKEGTQNGVKYSLCNGWGRVEAPPGIQEKFSHCQGISGIDLPVNSFSVYIPSGVVYLRNGNRHGLIDLREDIPSSVNITDQRKISACAFEMIYSASNNGETPLPNDFWVTALMDCLGDSLPPDNPEGEKLPFVWHNIP
ncbi:MAG: hypothetical protein M3O22_06870 [Pseudomonadota bacterium]|nr:hypothetical protein [Pseudomonadota bacterium]